MAQPWQTETGRERVRAPGGRVSKNGGSYERKRVERRRLAGGVPGVACACHVVSRELLQLNIILVIMFYL